MPQAKKLICRECNARMNHHAEKIDYAAMLKELNTVDHDLGGILHEVHTYPQCGETATRRAS